jgi:hypothetical protein
MHTVSNANAEKGLVVSQASAFGNFAIAIALVHYIQRSALSYNDMTCGSDRKSE